MYESTGNPTKGEIKGQTESERILMALDYKLDALDKIGTSVVTKVTALGGFELLKCEGCDAKKPQQNSSFIGELDLRLERMQRLIETYDAIRYNLERLA